ncbi:hypothetical protein OX284_004980 [Flavobacterium sp. SUN046]|uniref:hypothetical protein n=1 Tax=Flavobacterium sp. SUN046 TaxID=3002440 RepID=UPI002DBBFEE8|nr:hypothetical protein [Flavobacterium sp. SUN046]MEC4048775.1 hypothetical protein [Flavobacterium sp. SUN046]
MANQVEILNLDINTTALITKLGETRAEIERLKAVQKDLQSNNQQTSDSFSKNAIEIQRLQTSYNAQKNVVAQLTTANESFATASDSITAALGKEINTIAGARENNTQLLALRNQINIKTVEGQAALTAINAKLDENNNYIKSNVSAYEQQKISIGAYSAGIKEALGNINPLNGGMAGLAARSQEAGGAGNLLKTSLVGVISGMWGMIAASLAFIATPVGAVVALIAGAFLILYEVFKNFAPILNPIKDAFAALGAVFEVLKTSVFNLVTGAKSLSETFSGMGSAMNEAASEAYKLAEAQRAVTKEQRLLDVATAKATTQIQDYILKSKDRTLTEAQRIEYINKAQKLEEDINNRKLTQQNRIIANARMALAEGKEISDEDMKLLARGNSAFAQSVKIKYNLDQELIDKLREGEIAKEGILQGHNQIIEKSQNRENKLYEDQQAEREKQAKTNEDAEKKRQEQHQKVIDATIQKNKDEIEIYIQQQGIKKKSMEEEIAFEETLMKKRLAELKFELENNKLTQSAYNAAVLKEKNDFASKQTSIAVANADAELKAFLDSHKTLLSSKKFVDESLLQSELQRINDVSEAEAAAATKRFQQGVINELEYKAAIKAIDDKAATDKEAAEKTRAESIKIQKAADLENQRAIDADNFQNKFEADAANEEIRYQKELADAEKTGANKDLIEQKHAIIQEKISAAKEQAKRNSASQTFGELASLLGKETDAGKAAAIAQATINTYSGIAAVWGAESVLPEPFGTAAKVVSSAVVLASGLQAVQKITSTQTPKFRTGAIDINGAGTTTSDSITARISQGESVINANATQKWKPLLSYINSTGLSNNTSDMSTGYFATSTAINSNNQQSIDYDLLAGKMAEANRSIPAPIVSVHDINYQQQNYVRVVDFANH